MKFESTVIKKVISSLLLLALLLFSLSAPKNGSFCQLLDDLLLFNLLFQHEFLPFIRQFSLPDLSGFLFHSLVLDGRLDLKIRFFGELIFSSHSLSLLPFLEPFGIK